MFNEDESSLNMPQYPPHEIKEQKNVLIYMSNFQKIDGKK